MVGATHASAPAGSPGDDEVGDDAAGAAPGVTEVEVVRTGIVEVHCPFHQTQAKSAGVEVDRPLSVTANQRYVVQSFDIHRVALLLGSLRLSSLTEPAAPAARAW